MEKKEAVREWCFDSALRELALMLEFIPTTGGDNEKDGWITSEGKDLKGTNDFSKAVLAQARDIEKYINEG